MRFLKRNLSAIIIFLSMGIIFTTFTYVFSSMNRVTFVLKDIIGDKKALEGITISGVLLDKYHGQEFEIKDGQVSHKFKYYDNKKDIGQVPVYYHNGRAIDGSVYNYQEEYYIPFGADKIISTEDKPSEDIPNGGYNKSEGYTRRFNKILTNEVSILAHIFITDPRGRRTFENDTLKIDSGIRLKSANMEFELAQEEVFDSKGNLLIRHDLGIISSPRPYREIWNGCQAILGEKLFFTIPTTKRFSGENGIFVVDEFESWFFQEGKHIGKARKIVKWDLNNHDMDIFGLESLGDKLIAIMAIDDVLTIKVYSPGGKLINEVRLQDVKLWNNKQEESSFRHEYFTNGDILNISIVRNSLDGSQNETLITLEIKDSIKVKQKIDSLGFNNEDAQHFNIYSKGDKTYIVTGIKKIDDKGQHEPLIEQHFLIMVYENSRLIYKGELLTDADQDYKVERLKDNSGGFGYERLFYRSFQGIELR